MEGMGKEASAFENYEIKLIKRILGNWYWFAPNSKYLP